MTAFENTEGTLSVDNASGVSSSENPGWRIGVKISLRIFVGLVLITSLACLILIQLGYPRLQGVVPPDLMRPSGERSYTMPLPQPESWHGIFALVADGMDDPRASTLRLFEDDREIGPPHTAHTEIAKGGGGYSHWGDTLYFSSARGDDPRTSGREYRILAVYTPVAWLIPALVALSVLSGAALLAVTLGRSTFAYLRRFAPPVIYAATALGVLAIIVTSLVEFRQVKELKPTGMSASGGYAYAAAIPSGSSIPFLEPIPARRTSTGKPTVLLLEDGREVGMPRSQAAFINTLGAGRFVAVESTIQFSTPDNSDPRTNGRKYEVQERLGLPAGFHIFVVVLVVATLLLMARKRAGWVLGGLSATAAVGGIAGLLSYFDVIRYDEYVSPADIYHVGGQTYAFQITGNAGPFTSIAPVGAPTAVSIGGNLTECRAQPGSLAANAGSGRAACAPRDSGLDVDVLYPGDVAGGIAIEFYRYPLRVHPYATFGLLLISVVLALVRWRRPTPRQTLFGTGLLVGGCGALLMLANVAGFYLPLRAEMPTEPVQGIRELGPRMPLEEGVRLLQWAEGDTPESYARRANQVVFESMIHGDVSTDLGRWRLEIPLWENWSLHTLGVMNPSFQKYRYWNHEKEFERGIGLCGNLSAVLVGYLTENGIPARVVGLEGHVVVTAEVRPGVWYIFDPDYGVVLPHSLEQVQNDPGLVDAAYATATDANMRGMVVSYYATPENNTIDPGGRDGYYSGWDGSAEIYREREQFMELLKWVMPSGMLAIGLAFGLTAFLLRSRRREAPVPLDDKDSVLAVSAPGAA